MLSTPQRTTRATGSRSDICACSLEQSPLLTPVALRVAVVVDHVGPPVVQLALGAAGGLGQVAEPPAVVLADVAVAPFGAVHQALPAGEARVVEPVVAAAHDLGPVAPVVVLLAVRG